MTAKRSRPAANGAAKVSTTATGSTSTVDQDVPVAAILRVAIDRSGARSVVVRCPFRCRARKHIHGWPVGRPWPGLRVPHCQSAEPRPGSYWVGTVDGAVLEGQVTAR